MDLKLSDAQKEIFAGWQRPAETSGSEVVGEVDCDASSMTAVREIDLVQDITTDCSVVASLCAGVARVHRGHEKVMAISVSQRCTKLALAPELYDLSL